MKPPILNGRLSAVDAAFLYLERKAIPLNIQGIGIFDGPIPSGQSIYFLRQTNDDSYEILSFHAGVMPVENGKVEPLGKPLNDVLGHIKTVVRATRGPGD